MGSPETTINYDTSWTVARGSLEDCITFESSLSLINDQSSSSTTTVDSTAKSPLILCPTSPDHSTPCEITITFAQEHEVQQVYVRSTARIYEIYCASELNSENEYLCTVRCGIAARDEEVLHAAIDIEETVLALQKGITKELAEDRHNGSNVTSNEDDWVEVKVIDSPLVVSEDSSLSSSSDTSRQRNLQSQDLYEATAEISDANPCKSITLRLLSLQNKGYVCIDEVYVFADPVDATELDNKASPMESSAGNSLMAMLVPTFLQLSRTKGVSLAQDKHDTDRIYEQKLEEIEAKSDPIDAGNKSLANSKAEQMTDAVQKEWKSCSLFQEELQFPEAVTFIAKTVQPEKPPQVSDTESKPDISHNHIEGVLDQLVSRVGRIEDMFLRFEDCMLKPIRSIDERLQRVEQQLEVLMKKTQHSDVHSGTRISAPEFSCSESETNSLYNSGCMDLSYAACETNKKDSFLAVSSIHSDATPISENLTESHPSLVVTAPEFPNCDDDEEDDALELAKESPNGNQRLAMSIDDALASALAGFLSSTSVQSPRYTKTLAVKAPDFPCEEGNSNDEATLLKVPCECITEFFTGFSELEGTEHLMSSFSSLSNVSSLESDESVTRLPNNSTCMETGGEADEQWRYREGDEASPKGTCIELAAPAMHDMTRMNVDQINDDDRINNDTSNGEVSNGTSNKKAVERTDSLEQASGYQTDDGADTTKEGTSLNELYICTEVAEEGSDQDILQNVVELSRAAAQVDFETPILEVKFTCQENLNGNSPLEALLAGISGLNVEEVHPMKGSSKDDSQIGSQSDLIPVDWDAMSSATDNLISVDTEYYNLTLLPLVAEDATHLKND
ncbi:uncharacterized protein LOC8259321 [Ricinus communis]|uniref:Uncharacterized protein n=1 Tax=Ricinus communis TaxID=3988 RepID=B9RVP9_RICCO|nr:uncharacterized protein LOC8259321 [Ricinus communis]EEF44625.1 hypothetical protein RCOM_0968100 [Ricinus communis]|eukprot:XP_002517818.1 uncharacterized protein LOC8259321 [Ricinus communis]